MAVIASSNFGPVRSLVADAPAVKLPEEVADAIRLSLDRSEPPPVGQVKADNDPSNKYATLERDGKIIATFYKNGGMHTPNDVLVPENLKNDGQGKSLSDARIKQMMDIYGGSVKYTENAALQNASIAAATLFTAQIFGQ